MRNYLFLAITLCSSISAEFIDLEEMPQEFVLETKKIEIPGHTYAFNPSIVRWHGRLLFSFRIIPDFKKSYDTMIGLVWLDDDFSVVSEPQILTFRESGSSVPPRGEDARLLLVDDHLYIVYDDCVEPKLSKAGFRMHYAELHYDGGLFRLENSDRISRYEGETPELREKNWVPFDYKGTLLLAYSLLPHRIFCPIFGTGECSTIATTDPSIDWPWGILRGGTPGLLIDGEYLSFFHSSINMPTAHSQGRSISHYFIGAYTFSSEPPFGIIRISPEPIVAKGFYSGAIYKPFWKPIRCIYPAGIIFDDNYIWIAYGRQDHEAWIIKLDKKGLLQSLIPVKNH